MTQPIIDDLPAAPTRGESADNFAQKANAMAGALPPMVQQVNQLAAWFADRADNFKADFDLWFYSTDDTVTFSNGDVVNTRKWYATQFTEPENHPTTAQVNEMLSGLATITAMNTALAQKANTSHSHAIGDITGLSSALAAAGPATFESTEIDVPTATTVASATHGLGGVPLQYSVSLRCKTAEHGYSVGDEVDVTSQNDGDGQRLDATFVNATTISFVYRYTGLAVYSLNTNAVAAITLANWKLIFRAIK